MPARGATILQLLLLVALYHEAAAVHVMGPGEELNAQVIRSKVVPKGSAPWMVSVGTATYPKPVHVCGGVIVDYEWILTAAFCVSGGSPHDVMVVAGDHNISDTDGDELYRKVKAIFVHPEFDDYTRNNDIALLRLQHKLDETPYVKAIEYLRNPAPYTKETCTIVGWGVLSTDTWIQPTVLMGAKQIVFEQRDCKTVLPGFITDGMLCAADFSTGAGPCLGDWGGPLVCRGSELCGLASWGVGCGSTSLPPVYTNVTYYYDWVYDTAGLYEKLSKREL